MPATVFFSYSHHDEDLRDQLEKHLSILKRQGVIETWHDRRLTAGDDIDVGIADNMERADIVLFLVSSDFLASDYCYDVEVKRALERHDAGEARVIPVILRSCDWHPAPFGKLLALPTDGQPVAKFPDRNEAFLQITKGIRKAVEDKGRVPTHFGATATQRVAYPETPAETREVMETTRPRASNLRVTREFTTRDVDRFLVDTLEYIATYFENSLSELETRNRGIEGTFRRIDANRFTAAAYRNGDKATSCTIGFGESILTRRGIVYSSGDHGKLNTMNTMLEIFTDDQSIYMSSTWGATSSTHGSQDRKLTMEGSAEHLWDQFIEPLQRGR